MRRQSKVRKVRERNNRDNIILEARSVSRYHDAVIVNNELMTGNGGSFKAPVTCARGLAELR